MISTSLPAPTKAQKKTFEQLSDQIGCAICLFIKRIEGSKAEIHHIVEGGCRISHDHVIPLCKIHHRQGIPGDPSFHSVNGKHGGKAEFKEAYGVDEYDLLERCEEWIDRPYCTGDE